MSLNWTDTQRNRLVELDADATALARTFDDAGQRNRAFQTLEKERVAAHRRHLDTLRSGPRRPRGCAGWRPHWWKRWYPMALYRCPPRC